MILKSDTYLYILNIEQMFAIIKTAVTLMNYEVMVMPHLSRLDLENIGKCVTKAYCQLTDIQSSSVLKVDIVTLARELIGLNVEYHRLSPDQRILGVTSFFNVAYRTFDDEEQQDEQYVELDGKTILIESALDTYSKGRKNFTIAHETSHHILKRLYPQEYGVMYRRGRVHFYRENSMVRRVPVDWEEWQANVLASVILLPAECIRASMLKYGLGEKMKRLNRVFCPNEYDRFSEMAASMGASKTALALRMKQLGLLEENDLRDPYEMIRIYPDQEELNMI